MSAKENKKQHVMDVTRDFILEVGLQDVSMSKIAKRSEVPVGTIYYSFVNKEDLVNQVYVRAKERFMHPDFMKETMEGTMEEVIQNYLKAYIVNAMNHPQDFKFVEHYHMSPAIHEGNINDPDVTIGGMKMSEMMEQGIIKSSAPEIMDTVLVGMIHKSVLSHLHQKITLGEGEIDLLIQMCWDAIRVH